MATSVIKNLNYKINGYVVSGSKTSYDLGIARTASKTFSLSSTKKLNSGTLTSLGTMSLEAGTWIFEGHVKFPTGTRGSRTIQITNTGVSSTHWFTTVGQTGNNYYVPYFNVIVLSATTTITIQARMTGPSSMSITEANFRAIKI